MQCLLDRGAGSLGDMHENAVMSIGDVDCHDGLAQGRRWDSGGLFFTRSLAKRYLNKALKLLNELELPAFKKERLESIVNESYRTF